MAPELVVRIEHTGPVLVGFGGHWFLVGLYILQIFHYIRRYIKTDQLFIKIIVYVTSVGIIIHCWIITNAAWRLLVVGWGFPEIYAKVPVSLALPPVTSGIISMVVQCFYAWRIWMFGRSKLVSAVAAFIVMLASTQCGAAISWFVVFVNMGLVPSRMFEGHKSVWVWLTVSLACDTIVAFTMLVLLLRARSLSRLRATIRMINYLMILTVETGVFTVAAALTQLALYQFYPSFHIHIAVLYMLYGIYANVLLATLNGRDQARTAYVTTVECTFDDFSVQGHMSQFQNQVA